VHFKFKQLSFKENILYSWLTGETNNASHQGAVLDPTSIQLCNNHK